MSTDPNDFLMKGSKAASWPTIGTSYEGEITDLSVVQVRNFESGLPEFWDDGTPKEQLRVTLATDRRDGGALDDGQRAIFVRPAMRVAIKAAVLAAGAAGLEVGGRLKVTYVADGEPSRPGLSGPKQFSAVYGGKAPASVSVADL